MPNNSSNGNDFNAYQHQQQQQQHRPPSEHQQNSQPSSAVDDPNSHAEILDLDSHKVHQVCLTILKIITLLFIFYIK